jgi:hypothetical protein
MRKVTAGDLLTLRPSEEHELHGVQAHAGASGPTDRAGLDNGLAETGEAASGVAQEQDRVPAAGSDVHGVSPGVEVAVGEASWALRPTDRGAPLNWPAELGEAASGVEQE